MQDEDRQTQEAFDAVTGEAMALTPPSVEDQEADRASRDRLTIESVPGFDRPMSASPDDEVVAQDELTGQLIYQTALGERYTISLNPDQRTARTRFEEDTLPAMQDYFENPTLPTVSQTAGFVGDVAQGAYETLEGAVQGRGTIGDVTGLAVGSGAGSMFGEVPEGALRIFGGFNAAADPGVDASGRALPRSVGADTLDRFEIDDSVATFNPQMLGGTDLTSKGLKNFDWAKVNANPRTYFATLDQVIDHPELFRQYPELGGVNVVVDTTIGPGRFGYYYEPGNLIAVSESVARSPKLFAETLIHEIQHDVQRREGFDRGTSARSQQVSDRAAPQLAELQTQYDTLSQDFDNFDFDNSLSKVADFTNRLAEKLDQDGSLGSTSFTYKSPVRDGRRNLDFLAGFLTTDPTDAKESYKRVIDFYSLIRDNPNLISPEDTEEFITVFKIDPEELSQLSNQDFMSRLESEGIIPVHPSSVLAERDLLRSRTYFERSGEVEARNVANRLGLSLDERFNLHPVSTEDASAPRERQWTVDNEGNIREVRDFPVVPELEQQEGLLSRALRALRGNRGSEFNKGGVVSMEEQMSLFDMGGLTDDGAMRDPVSGNEIPPGSMATEVRDDVPAMLSEGEYIVPADVVRYYGVKFFEDLRGQAKSGMMDMERNGRIGGEPVGAPEDDLTPEEMQMLAEITGMYAGGMVKGYQEGGVVDQPFTPIPNYNIPGFSLFQPTQTAAPVVPTQTQNVTLYGPNGEVVTLTLPTDQERYNQLLAQGYTTEPRAPTGVGVVTSSDSDSNAGGVAPTTPTTGGGGSELDFKPLDPETYGALSDDPLAFGRAALEGRDFTRAAGGLGSAFLGPAGALIGGGVAAGMTANNVAQARAASQIAKAKGLDTTALDAEIDSYISGLPNIARGASLLATGDQMAERYFNTAMDLRLGEEYGPGGIGRDFFVDGPAGETAYNQFMQSEAPPGYAWDPNKPGRGILTYNEQTKKFEDRGEITQPGGYVRTDDGPSEPLAPRASIRPVQKPARQPDGTPTGAPESSSDSGSDRDSGSSNDTNVGNYGGDRDGDGVPNWRDFNDGAGWADNNKDESEDTSGACFLTTAVVEMRGEEDDGYTLSTLRKFRDTYLRNKNDAVEKYYEVAPKLVKAIPKEDKTWLWIGRRVDKAIEYIEEGKNGLAYQTYKRMVEKLERDWLKEK